MASPAQLAALSEAYTQAQAAGVLYPNAQACELMVETTWGTSELFLKANNGFGMKQHQVPVYGTINFPTKEFVEGGWETIDADFVSYPTVADCFADRMATLLRLAPLPGFEHYAAALAATTPEDFLTQVSLKWSTGPQRGPECVQILHAHEDLLGGTGSTVGIIA